MKSEKSIKTNQIPKFAKKTITAAVVLIIAAFTSVSDFIVLSNERMNNGENYSSDGKFVISIISDNTELKNQIDKYVTKNEERQTRKTIEFIDIASSDDLVPGNANIWVDELLINNAKVKENLNKTYSAGRRIIILGKNQSRKRILEYFNEDTADIGEVFENSENRSDIPQRTNYVKIANRYIGIMIYKMNGIANTTTFFSDEDMGEVVKLLIDATEYDYIGLAMGTLNSGKNSSDFSKVSAELNNTWNSIKVSTRTDSCSRFTMSMSLKIDKNSGNPNNAGQYLYYSAFKADINVKPYTGGNPLIYCNSISKSNLKNIGKAGVAVYDYSPHNRNPSSANISVSLPYSISASFSPETYVKITKTSGGIDTASIGIDYKITNWLGLQCYEFDSMWCEAHYEAFQNNSIYQTSGDYLITTYEMELYGGDPVNCVNFYPGNVFTISGT